MKKAVLLSFALFLILFSLYKLLHVNYKSIFYSDSINIEKTPIDNSAISDINQNLDTINKYCHYYCISPKIIMGIVIAERSLHKGPANYFEEYYVKTEFLSKSESYLKQLVEVTKQKLENMKMARESDQEFGFRLKHGLIWTIGLCQISIMKSIEIDSAIAKSENCPVKTVKENIGSLLTPSLNIKYCAFEIKEIQEKYIRETGLDISNNIGVLCTLYNTGRINESIARYKQTNIYPRANLFGKFAEIKMDTLLSILKLNPPEAKKEGYR